jgi:hypothetical protein
MSPNVSGGRGKSLAALTVENLCYGKGSLALVKAMMKQRVDFRDVYFGRQSCIEMAVFNNRNGLTMTLLKQACSLGFNMVGLERIAIAATTLAILVHMGLLGKPNDPPTVVKARAREVFQTIHCSSRSRFSEIDTLAIFVEWYPFLLESDFAEVTTRTLPAKYMPIVRVVNCIANYPEEWSKFPEKPFWERCQYFRDHVKTYERFTSMHEA